MIRLAEEIRLGAGRPHRTEPSSTIKAEYHDLLRLVLTQVATPWTGRRDVVPRRSAGARLAGYPRWTASMRGVACISLCTDEHTCSKRRGSWGVTLFSTGDDLTRTGRLRLFLQRQVSENYKHPLRKHTRCGRQTLGGFQATDSVEKQELLISRRRFARARCRARVEDPARSGRCERLERERLIGAGADIVIPATRESARCSTLPLGR